MRNNVWKPFVIVSYMTKKAIIFCNPCIQISIAYPNSQNEVKSNNGFILRGKKRVSVVDVVAAAIVVVQSLSVHLSIHPSILQYCYFFLFHDICQIEIILKEIFSFSCKKTIIENGENCKKRENRENRDFFSSKK